MQPNLLPLIRRLVNDKRPGGQRRIEIIPGTAKSGVEWLYFMIVRPTRARTAFSLESATDGERALLPSARAIVRVLNRNHFHSLGK